jgi:S1-C subfamily serine protease
MDAPVSIAREAVISLIFLRSRVPAAHPSAAILGEERLGAGVAVAPRRVLTAHYLVLGASEIEVVGCDGRPRGVARKTLDHDSGLALLCTEGSELRPVAFAAAPIQAGLPVFLLTCTGEQERKGATGHVTAVAPFEAFWEYMLDGAIMTTVVNPGLAGAPLFDREARLLGVVSLGLASVGRYSLAIPAELYLRDQDGFEQDAPGSAREPRAWIGFYPQVRDEGVVVTGLVPDGPADRAGLLRGDLVLSVDGTPVSSLRELYGEIRKKQPGQAVGLHVLRDSSLQTCEIAAGNRCEFYK